MSINMERFTESFSQFFNNGNIEMVRLASQDGFEICHSFRYFSQRMVIFSYVSHTELSRSTVPVLLLAEAVHEIIRKKTTLKICVKEFIGIDIKI